ncbi:cilia- and flagella-associated protein 157 [Tribolium madens]|uniref:cilia- and flagella-associated protein 157 n=1 Tax=Tribolium madens TaxID=41895 RepID=UPI001CF73A8D|nr:cilia- and flagella-associated protein 157 [Tribolium madens]
MAKGKKKGKKKKAPKIDPNALTEVDKTFYELTITDLNRKLARLRSLTTELEEKNEELQTNLSKLDEDRNDIIIYLKRMLQERSDEIAELQERLRALEETRQDETEKYETKIADLEAEYKQMHEQLTSEIKLLEGKLNSLEEFRIQRDELMKKFEDQETAMEEQEKRHKNELYDIERKFIIGKDKLKKDMEARLLQLSSEFQEATELRIAATTHRVIRENIAINNELDAMLITHQKLYSENATMKDRDRTLRQETELHEAEKNKALSKVRVQLKLIERLTTEHEDMKQKLMKYQSVEQEMHETSEQLLKTQQDVLCLNHKIKLLQQNIHALKCRETSLKTELSNLDFDNDRLTTVLAQAVLSIKEVLELKSRVSDEALKASKRENLLTQLFILLSEAEGKKDRKPSLDTVGSISTYERGDLGFVPKPLTRRSTLSTLRDIQAQTGPSFEEFLAIGKEEELVQQETSLISSEEESKGSEGTFVEEESDVFFNEEEDAVEDSLLEFDELSDEAREVAATKTASELIVESALSSASIAKKLSGTGTKSKSRSRISFKEKGLGETSREALASTEKLRRVSIGETTEMVIPESGAETAETTASEPST